MDKKPMSLYEMNGRNQRQTVPMSKERYRQLRFTRPDLWSRCMFCPAQGKAYFLDIIEGARDYWNDNIPMKD